MYKEQNGTLPSWNLYSGDGDRYKATEEKRVITDSSECDENNLKSCGRE